MRQVRLGTFETNSSSTHSLVMCTESEFDAFTNGETYYADWVTTDIRNKLPEQYQRATFVPKDIVDTILEELGESDDRSEYFKTCDEFFDNEYLESFEDHYTTPGGETVVAFGLFGYDG